jgi:hypothetical protein
MPRPLDTAFAAALSISVVRIAFGAKLTFLSGVSYVWSGIGNLVIGGNTFLGVGELGSISDVSESGDVRADGMTIGLSGVDQTTLNDSMSEIQQGAPAAILMILFDANGNVIGTPATIFGGQVDQPAVSFGAASSEINLSLESALTNLQRATCRRYTSGDQQIYFPTDSGFNWVEILNDIALLWN